MAKTRSPFYSLSSRGTIGKALTTQGGQGKTIVRSKPKPTDRYTLPQAYQRWLYEDYAHLWTQQSESTKRQYASTGVRFHLTGFQYWMKYQLTNLPDIAGFWKLDDVYGPTTPDSSRNSNTATIIGASPDFGLINRCLHFDGLNDRLTIPDSPSLNIRTAITALAFIYPTGWGTINSGRVLSKTKWRIYVDGTPGATRILGIIDVDGIPLVIGTSANSLFLNIWQLVALLFDGSIFSVYINGTLWSLGPNPGTIDDSSASILAIGDRATGTRYFDGLIDNVIIYNRALSLQELDRWNARRYPA